MKHWTSLHESGSEWQATCGCGWVDSAPTRNDAVRVARAHKANPQVRKASPQPVISEPEPDIDGLVAEFLEDNADDRSLYHKCQGELNEYGSLVCKVCKMGIPSGLCGTPACPWLPLCPCKGGRS